LAAPVLPRAGTTGRYLDGVIVVFFLAGAVVQHHPPLTSPAHQRVPMQVHTMSHHYGYSRINVTSYWLEIGHQGVMASETAGEYSQRAAGTADPAASSCIRFHCL